MKLSNLTFKADYRGWRALVVYCFIISSLLNATLDIVEALT